ncbi:MAG TPA: winged helix DNA-binding domain-containing protein [Tessaracoccus flavescens]|uniref:Winged helix DNA-binding domain-containing protein n=1 Tax=Tessaracoccus flavescens TaxID=399497 RepID=A0A921JQ40_9ACTN|nr:winged helix DNA-binding domain-containing protein [Tessaracoccus flavescens]
MPDVSLGRLRLVAQGLIDRPFARPADALTAFGAMQGQDLPGAIASAALRSTGSAEDVIDDLNAGRIVRSYPMRGTVFLMPASDALWITELCAKPSLRAASSRRRDIDESHIARASEVTRTVLADGPRSRGDVLEAWTAAGLSTAEGRGYHVLFHLIAGGEVCYGPWNGADQDVALAADWLPRDSSLDERFDGDRIAATAELLRRYFTSHGPATVRDFAWWTKLTLTEIRAALPLVAGELETDGETEPSFWAPGLRERAADLGRAVNKPLLLPGFDEFILGYQDRLFAMNAEEHTKLVPGNNGVFQKSVVVGGRVRGLWRRGGRPGKRALAVDGFAGLTDAAEKKLGKLFDEFPFVGP